MSVSETSVEAEYINFLKLPLQGIIESAECHLSPNVPWDAIRGIAQKLYTEIANQEHLTISLEKTYMLIFQVCKQDPENLLYFLEKEALYFLVELKTQLNLILTDPSLQSGGEKLTSRTLVQSLWTLWENLSTSIKIFNGLLIYLHNYIKEHHINFNFGQVNQVLFLELLLNDPLVSKYIRISRAMMHASAKAGSKSNVPDKFIAFEATLRGIRMKWPFIKNQIAMFHFVKNKRFSAAEIALVVPRLRDMYMEILPQTEAASEQAATHLDGSLAVEEYSEDYEDKLDDIFSDEETDEEFGALGWHRGILPFYSLLHSPVLIFYPDGQEYSNTPHGIHEFEYVESDEEDEDAGELPSTESPSSSDTDEDGDADDDADEGVEGEDDAIPFENDDEIGTAPGTPETDSDGIIEFEHIKIAPRLDPRSIEDLVQFIEGDDKPDPSNLSKSKKKRLKKKKKQARSIEAQQPVSVSQSDGGAGASASAGDVNSSGSAKFPKFWEEEPIGDPTIQNEVEAEVERFSERLAQLNIRPTGRLKIPHYDDLARFSRENPKNIFRHLYQKEKLQASDQKMPGGKSGSSLS